MSAGSAEATPDPSTLVEVRLVGLALEEHRASSAHHDELFREFALVLVREPSPGHDLPARLLALIEELNEQFGEFVAAPTAELEAAIARGDDSVDLVFRVPPGAGPAALRLGELLAAADEYCRRGELLTVAPRPAAVAYRNWYLDEFVGQIQGRAPTPWPEYAARLAASP